MRRLTRLLATAALVLPAAAVVPASAPAHAAAAGDLTCSVSAQVTFDPGLRLFQQQHHISWSVGYSNCTSTSPTEITSGTHSGSFVGPRGCLSVPPTTPATLTITWDTGATSTVEGTAAGRDVGGQTVHITTGTVTEGEFIGALFVETIVQVNPDPVRCVFPPGVTSQTGLGTVAIT